MTSVPSDATGVAHTAAGGSLHDRRCPDGRVAGPARDDRPGIGTERRAQVRPVAVRTRGRDVGGPTAGTGEPTFAVRVPQPQAAPLAARTGDRQYHGLAVGGAPTARVTRADSPAFRPDWNSPGSNLTASPAPTVTCAPRGGSESPTVARGG